MESTTMGSYFGRSRISPHFNQPLRPYGWKQRHSDISLRLLMVSGPSQNPCMTRIWPGESPEAWQWMVLHWLPTTRASNFHRISVDICALSDFQGPSHSVTISRWNKGYWVTALRRDNRMEGAIIGTCFGRNLNSAHFNRLLCHFWWQ